jgi:hypothetical protein
LEEPTSTRSRRLITHGSATAEEIPEHLAAIDAGLLDITTPPFISAWAARLPTD